MKKTIFHLRSLTIFVVLIVLLVSSVATVSAARGGEPGKPDNPGKPENSEKPGNSSKTPPGQAKKAGTEDTSTKPVERITGFSCRINQSPIGGEDTFSPNSRSLVTPSGNTILKCTGDISPELTPSKAVIDTGFECFTSLGATMESRKVFTPSGKVHLTCMVNGQNKIDY